MAEKHGRCAHAFFMHQFFYVRLDATGRFLVIFDCYNGTPYETNFRFLSSCADTISL